MNAKKSKTGKRAAIQPVRPVPTRQVIVNFDPERFKAPLLLRAGALLIDYILLILFPVGGLLLARFMGLDGQKLLNSELNNMGWLIMILLGVTNFVIFPMFSGQSIGKMLTGLRIVKIDGTGASFSRVLMRNVVGYLLTVMTFGVGLLIAIISSSGRALHDYLSGTMVVYGRRKIEKKIDRARKSKRIKSKRLKERLAVEGGGQRFEST